MSWSDDRATDAMHWKILRNHLQPNVWPTSREMFKYKQELDSVRHADLNQLANSVQNMKKKLSYLKKTAADVKKIKAVGFDNFRRDIKLFESNLSKLKEGGLKKLREETHKQCALIDEIERVKQLTLNDVISNSHHSSIIKKKKELKPIKRIPISKNTYSSKEIADFHDFCARNFGLTGGWSTKDHETFLKIRLRHDGVDFIDHVIRAMPHISNNAVRDHENWFIKFEELKLKQKEAILKWKNKTKNNISSDCNSNTYNTTSISNKCRNADNNDAEITWKTNNDNLKKKKNEHLNNYYFNEPQHKICEPTNHNNIMYSNKTLTQRYFREKDKRYTDSMKSIKQRKDNERTLSDSITIVTLHGKVENYDDTESPEKIPNLHFSIYGPQNQDVKVVLKY